MEYITGSQLISVSRLLSRFFPQFQEIYGPSGTNQVKVGGFLVFKTSGNADHVIYDLQHINVLDATRLIYNVLHVENSQVVCIGT